MAKDFEQIGHKNIELLRFYISKQLNDIDKKIVNNDSQIKGYVYASVIDILIVTVFDNQLKCSSLWFKGLICFALLILFYVVSKFIATMSNYMKEQEKKAGRDKDLTDNVLLQIDKFDNIACDGLLICENYIKKYKEEKEQYIKNFYLHEIIHYLTKIVDIFRPIYAEQGSYIKDDNKEFLDSYRVNNFIVFAKEINKFLCDELIEIRSETGGTHSDVLLRNHLINLNEAISNWKTI